MFFYLLYYIQMILSNFDISITWFILKNWFEGVFFFFNTKK